MLSPAAPARFFLRRWRGQIGWRTLFWRDMLVHGTLLNFAASFGALMLAALGAPGAAAAALHFAPVPYNAFLLMALWRLPRRPLPALAAAVLWTAAMIVV